MKTLIQQMKEQVSKVDAILTKYEDNLKKMEEVAPQDPSSNGFIWLTYFDNDKKLRRQALKAVNGLAEYLGVAKREKRYYYSRDFFNSLVNVVEQYELKITRVQGFVNL